HDEITEGDRQEQAVPSVPVTQQEVSPSALYGNEPISALYSNEPSDSSIAPPEHVLDEFELLAIREGFADVEEPTSELATIGDEPLLPETGTATANVLPGSSEGAPQTATVREQEQGGRFTHRSSRRMRRRRGGNRFGGQQGGPSTPENRVAESPIAVAAGASAALAPEVRNEVRSEPAEERSAEKADRVYPSISDLLKPGQEIIVQIAKEPLGQKGARITSHIALPGRYVVFMPSVHHLGVSRKVESDEERQRLKRILQTHRVGTTGGFIVRTAGEGIPEDEIAADMNFLYSLWLDIRQKAEKKPAPALLHYDLDVVQRILRDQVTEEFKAIWVDNEDLYESVLTFMQRFQPAFVNRVKMYTRTAPIFDAFNITQELEKALRPKVWLKSGGYIVINQTEALVAIDINTGKYVGKSNRLEDTIVKTNTEAVKEIVRQIRLRDLGGIIVVDFIDMDERKNRQKVMQALEEAMRADKAPYKILQFNDFGLVAITRKRVKQSLERTLCSSCPYCEGAGYVKSVQTVISEILVEAQKIARAIQGKEVVLRVHPEVAKVLKASSNQYLEEIEEILGCPVLVTGDPTLHHQKFDLA
nr:Rne/Rng family ribonuclease [Acidobacteriota bacterium]